MGLFLTGEYHHPESIKGYQALKFLSLKKSGYLGEKERVLEKNFSSSDCIFLLLMNVQ